jgi:hypothetical protein
MDWNTWKVAGDGMKRYSFPCASLLSSQPWRRMGSGDIAPPFLTLALDKCECSASCPGRFIRLETAFGTHCIRGWVDPRASLDSVERRKSLVPVGNQTFGRPDHSRSLYQLSYKFWWQSFVTQFPYIVFAPQSGTAEVEWGGRKPPAEHYTD